MRKEKSCGAIIINDKKEVLLVKQTKGHYSFPKGHVEAGETEIETAIRETKEETNIDIIVDDTKKYKITYQVGENVIKDVIYFLAHPISYKLIPQITEVIELLWVPIDDVNKYLGFENIIKVWNEEIINDIKKKEGSI